MGSPPFNNSQHEVSKSLNSFKEYQIIDLARTSTCTLIIAKAEKMKQDISGKKIWNVFVN